MQINCPNCSTTYVLDERLLPPAGAPVQCTKCAHVFTAKPDDVEPQRGSTQIFGLKDLPTEAPEGDVSPEAPKERTQIFGKTPTRPPEAAAPRPHATQVFGTVGAGEPGAPGPRPVRHTQMFAALGDAGPAASPAPPAPFNPRATQVFGTAASMGLPVKPPGAVPAAPTTTPPTRTQTFGATVQPPGAKPSSTQTFGATPQPPAGAQNKTQTFGAAPAASAEPAAFNPRATMVFAGAPQRPTIKVSSPFASEPAHPAPPSDPGAPDLATTPGEGSPRSAVELPAELAVLRGGAGEPLSAPDRQELSDDSTADFERSIRRRNRIAVGVILAGLLGIAGWAGYRYLAQRPAPVPPEATLALDRGVMLLRKDDTQSLGEAADLFKQLRAAYPGYLGPKVELTIAEALLLDDAQIEISRVERVALQLNADIVRLQTAKSTSDWQNRVNAMIDQLEGLKKKTQPLNERSKGLTTELGQSMEALARASDALSEADREEVSRAQAVYFGVLGKEQVNAAAAATHGQGRGPWAAIALAEFAVNSKVNSEALDRAHAAMDTLRAEDATLMRAYVLSARLSIVAHRWDAASSVLEAVLTLNPSHDAARALLADVQAVLEHSRAP